MTMRERLAAAMDGPPPVSQAALARAVGIAQPTVNNWLSGQTKTIRGDLLILVANHLHVRPEWLANGTGPMRVNAFRNTQHKAGNGGVKFGVESDGQSQTVRTDPDRMRDALYFVEVLAELQGVPSLARDPIAISIAYDFLAEFDQPTEQGNVLDITKRLAAKIRGDNGDNDTKGTGTG